MSQQPAKKPRTGGPASSSGGGEFQPQDAADPAALRAEIDELRAAAQASAGRESFLAEQLKKTSEALVKSQEAARASGGRESFDTLMSTDAGKRWAAERVAREVGDGIRAHVSSSGWDRTQPYPSLKAVQGYRDGEHLQAGRDSPAWLFQVRAPFPSPPTLVARLPPTLLGRREKHPSIDSTFTKPLLLDPPLSIAPSLASGAGFPGRVLQDHGGRVRVGPGRRDREPRGPLRAVEGDDDGRGLRQRQRSLQLHLRHPGGAVRQVQDQLAGDRGGRLRPHAGRSVVHEAAEHVQGVGRHVGVGVQAGRRHHAAHAHGDVGRYKTGTARIGDTGTLKSATVTNAAAVLFRDGDDLQRKAALAPACWENQWRDVPDSFFELETQPR